MAHAIGKAQAYGYRVLSCLPGEGETHLAFSGLRDLLDAAYEDVADGLPPPQRRALDVALLRAEPGPQPPDQGAVAAAFLASLRLLAVQNEDDGERVSLLLGDRRRLRIVVRTELHRRPDDVLVTYYRHAGRWVKTGWARTPGSVIIALQLGSGSDFSHQTVRVAFDNFSAEADGVDCPNGIPTPPRKPRP